MSLLPEADVEGAGPAGMATLVVARETCALFSESAELRGADDGVVALAIWEYFRPGFTNRRGSQAMELLALMVFVFISKYEVGYS